MSSADGLDCFILKYTQGGGSMSFWRDHFGTACFVVALFWSGPFCRWSILEQTFLVRISCIFFSFSNFLIKNFFAYFFFQFFFFQYPLMSVRVAGAAAQD